MAIKAIKAIKIILDPAHNMARYNQGAAPAYWEGRANVADE